MQRIHTQNWFTTPEGEPRGYIDPQHLRELWFHTGTACNLQCSFCLEGSGPGDTRLELVKFADIKPIVDEALSLGVEQFSFTGGEPFLAKQLVQILHYAASFKPCLVLTNGTEAIQQRMDEVRTLREASHAVSFRVSIDKPTAALHDAGRGEGTFVKALQGLKGLYDAGFSVSVARHMDKGEMFDTVDSEYRCLFQEYGLPKDLTIVAFPDFATPGSLPNVPQVTTACMTTYQTEDSRKNFMCAYSKMVVKQRGKMRVYACTLVDDDEEYDQGGSLTESLLSRVSMKHHRCYSCFAYGSSCSES
jgi:sulfatase maturation enzyme AslB (radical SAM superfamily)